MERSNKGGDYRGRSRGGSGGGGRRQHSDGRSHGDYHQGRGRGQGGHYSGGEDRRRGDGDAGHYSGSRERRGGGDHQVQSRSGGGYHSGARGRGDHQYQDRGRSYDQQRGGWGGRRGGRDAPPPTTLQKPTDTIKQEVENQLHQRSSTTKPRGKEGTTIHIYSNHFPMQLEHKIAHHYDVAIDKKVPKNLLMQAIEAFRAKHFPNRYPSFDSKNLFSGRPLFKEVEMEGEVNIKEPDGRTITLKLKVKKVAEIDLSVIERYLRGDKNVIPKNLTVAKQCLEIVLRNAAARNYLSVGRSFFGTSNSFDLPNYNVMYLGFQQSITVGERLFLNVDVASKAFSKEVDVIDLIADPKKELTHWQIEDLEDRIKGLKVRYMLPDKASTKRNVTVSEVAKLPAYKEMFQHENRKISVKTYYRDVLKYTLKYPHLPCLKVKKPKMTICYPIECCRLLPNQALSKDKQQDAQIVREMIKYANTDTNERKTRILNARYSVDYNQNAGLNEFGLTISQKMQRLDGRVLETPQITYKDGTTNVRDGQWKPQKFFPEVEIKDWYIINLDANMKRFVLDNFAKMLVDYARSKGVSVAQAQIKDQPCRNVKEVTTTFQKLNFQLHPQLLIVVVPSSTNEKLYESVKQTAELQLGYLTQCVKSETLNRKLNEPTVINILLKINTKMNGMNHRIDVLGETSSLLEGPCIIFGADVTHPPPRSPLPSFAAVTASCDLSAYKYSFSWRIQPARDEIINDLEEIAFHHLSVFQKTTGKTPKRIIFYRDGVADGYFDEVRTREIAALRKAYARFAKNETEPIVTFLVVQKRHHTRFFPADEEAMIPRDSNNNVRVGTCVDTVITDPDPASLDFYLVSHRSIQGVARPTKYWVLRDDASMSDDEVEKLTFYLCHLYARCTRAVSYPTPTYYAHLAAARAKVYFADQDWTNVDVTDGKALKRLQERRAIKADFANAHPMFFV